MAILDAIYPKKCLGCKTAGCYICPSCLAKVRPSKVTGPNTVCLWKYEGVIRKAIITLKYRFVSDVAQELAKIVSRKLKKQGKWPLATVIPIPLHKKRKNWRGFNQAEEMGKLLAQEMQWEFLPDFLVRVKHKKPQVKLTRGERVESVKGIFEINQKYKITTSPYILFDDVYTTGSTMAEAQKTLQKAGVKFVFNLAIAG